MHTCYINPEKMKNSVENLKKCIEQISTSKDEAIFILGCLRDVSDVDERLRTMTTRSDMAVKYLSCIEYYESICYDLIEEILAEMSIQ